MKKLIVKNINNYDYTLIDNDNNIHVINIEFYSKLKPNIGDIIYLDDSLLTEVNLFSFDEFNDMNNLDKKDIIKVVSKNGDYYLQRRFG